MSEAKAAELLWQAWQAGRTMATLPADCRPADVAAGYRIQRAIAKLADSAAYGWKIAATNVEGQRHIGVPGPVAGRLFHAGRHADGATVPLTGNAMRVAEPEFAFRMARDLPQRAVPYSAEEALAAADELFLALEVPDSRFADFAKAGGAQLTADNACAHRFVLGAAATGWRHADLAAHRVSTSRNGALFSEGVGANVLGGPAIALAWLANELPAHGEMLRAGEIVTTGTLAKPVPVAPGDRVEADFGSFGRVAARFVD